MLAIPGGASAGWLSVSTVARGTRLHPGTLLTAPSRIRGHRVRRYQWERCNRRGQGCKKIPHATLRTYRLTKRDVGHTLRAVETLVDDVTVTSAPTVVVGPPLPVNTILPVIVDLAPTVAGQVTEGDVLTGTLGTWTGAVSFEWAWEDCDTTGANCTISSTDGPTDDPATVPSYTLTASDVGHTIRLVVTAFNTDQT